MKTALARKSKICTVTRFHAPLEEEQKMPELQNTVMIVPTLKEVSVTTSFENETAPKTLPTLLYALRKKRA